MVGHFDRLWSFLTIFVVLCNVDGQLNFMDIWRRHQANVKNEALGYKNFGCPSRRPAEFRDPPNIHMIRPEDIGVIGALGDSITTGTGAGALTMDEIYSARFRGFSFSTGGEESLETVVTLPNIFRKFNEEIYGASTSTSVMFNVAVPGARARDMPAQAKELARRIWARPHLSESWKVITIFIGINDICHACYSDIEAFRQAPHPWLQEIDESLNILSATLSKTFVNLVTVFPVWQFRQLEKYSTCASNLKGCRCMSSAYNYYRTVDGINKNYQKSLNELLGKYDRADFTSVVQPFLANFVFPPSRVSFGPDLSYVSPDCFHFSRRWHAAAAAALWNNMLESTGTKTNKTELGGVYLNCPDRDCPYLRTSINSINCSKSFLLDFEHHLHLQYHHSNITNPLLMEPQEIEGTTGRAALWIFLIFVLSALIAGGVIYWYRRKYRRGSMDLARLASRFPEDPQVPLMAVHDLRNQSGRTMT